MCDEMLEVRSLYCGECGRGEGRRRENAGKERELLFRLDGRVVVQRAVGLLLDNSSQQSDWTARIQLIGRGRRSKSIWMNPMSTLERCDLGTKMVPRGVGWVEVGGIDKEG